LTGGHTPELAGSELLLPLALAAVKAGRLSLEALVALTAEGPARWLDLPRKGRIERGADADLVLVGEAEVGRIVAELAGPEHPYVDREVGLWPELVLKGGQVVARRGRLQDGPAGRPLTRGA
jgi:dihydroorotase